jgi:hypothetical protein
MRDQGLEFTKRGMNMKCLDCGIDVNYELPEDPKERMAMQLVYEGVICRPCAGDSCFGALLEKAGRGDSHFKVVNFRRRKNIDSEALKAL